MTDRRERILALLPEINLIQNERMREGVINIWVEVWSESAWDDPSACPKSHKNVTQRSNIDHVRSVTKQALATAEIAREIHGFETDTDILLAGALLHDVSKLVECEPGPSETVTSHTGVLIQHGVYGAAKAIAHGLPLEVAHILISHTHQSATVPATPESIIIHYVDFLDSDLLLHEIGHRLFAKR